jgi:hypothetical protein
MVYQLPKKVEELRPVPAERPSCQVITLRPLTGQAAVLARRRADRRRNLRRLGWESGGKAA